MCDDSDVCRQLAQGGRNGKVEYWILWPLFAGGYSGCESVLLSDIVCAIVKCLGYLFD
jgi:hypothetical protein